MMKSNVLAVCVARCRAVILVRTIRSQIFVVLLAMSVISALVGVVAVRDLQRAGGLVDRTFDRSLMSINYARAASADFNALQALFARRLFAKTAGARASMDKEAVELEAEMAEDLLIAVERAQSERVRTAGQRVDAAIAAWTQARRRVADATEPDVIWSVLDREAAVVGQQLDLLINYTAGDGFIARQNAHRTIQDDKRFIIAAALAALVTSCILAWLLARRMIKPISKASSIAARIAAGNLDVVVPVGQDDELGALLLAMEAMRGAIKASLVREVAMRHSAQTRLADALESSREGVIVVDAEATIALVNTRMATLLEAVCPPVQAGDSADALMACIGALPGSILEREGPSSTREAALPGGRWLRVSSNATRDGGSIIVCGDISLVKAQEAALKATNLWLDAALSNLSQGVCLFDSDNRLQVYNNRFCAILGIEPAGIMPGASLADIVGRSTAVDEVDRRNGRFLAAIEARIRRRRPVTDLLALKNNRTISLSHRPIDDQSWLATLEDVTDRLQAQQKISFMARHDALTGLPNRVLFAERIEAALLAVGRGQGFAILCLDLDHFKQVNDTLGHPVGDSLLRVLADCLRDCVRETDMVARLGGDEFAIVQSAITGPQEVTALAGRIVDLLSRPFEIAGNRITVGVSIGISLAPGDGTSYDKLLKHADVALYKAKSDGRNTWRFFESEMDERLQARRVLELDLRDALDKQQFELRYQPLYDVVTDKICGAEALIRWHHPERGCVAPSSFIPVAEEIGLITPIGEWVLARACHDAAQWPDDVSVAVNVSAAQFREGRLVAKVVEVLYASGLPAHRLELEITESVLLTNSGAMLLALRQLRGLGIRVSMDDFGTGYSSLSYLRSFPFDKVKIDRSFAVDVASRDEARAIVRTVIALCTSLGMRTTAEGIETREQLEILRAEQCHEVQGFYLSDAVSSAAFVELLGRTWPRSDEEQPPYKRLG